MNTIENTNLTLDPEEAQERDEELRPERVELHSGAAVDSASEVSQDSVSQLLTESRRWPLLTADEEIQLSQRFERGELDAKERMINSNLRRVLVRQAVLARIRAVEKFDWRRGYRFSPYATLWIRQAMQRGLENSGRTIRLRVTVGQRAAQGATAPGDRRPA